MNSRKDIILVILGALLLVAGSVVYLTPGLVAPIVPDEEGKAAAIKLLKDATPQVDQRVLVVPRKLSSFVVQIDYLSLPEEKLAAGTEGEPKK